MDDIAPPKPRTNLGRKRGKQEPRILSIKTKARYAAKKVIKTQNEKIKKARQLIENAKVKKETVLKTDSSLKGEAKSVMTDKEIENLPPTIQDHVKENIVFEPNQGPQTEFWHLRNERYFTEGREVEENPMPCLLIRCGIVTRITTVHCC